MIDNELCFASIFKLFEDYHLSEHNLFFRLII